LMLEKRQSANSMALHAFSVSTPHGSTQPVRNADRFARGVLARCSLKCFNSCNQELR
jgi:hypothetical protein